MTFVGARYLRPPISRRIRIRRQERRIDHLLNFLDTLALGMVALVGLYFFGGWLR